MDLNSAMVSRENPAFNKIERRVIWQIQEWEKVNAPREGRYMLIPRALAQEAFMYFPRFVKQDGLYCGIGLLEVRGVRLIPVPVDALPDIPEDF